MFELDEIRPGVDLDCWCRWLADMHIGAGEWLNLWARYLPILEDSHYKSYTVCILGEQGLVPMHSSQAQSEYRSLLGGRSFFVYSHIAEGGKRMCVLDCLVLWLGTWSFDTV